MKRRILMVLFPLVLGFAGLLFADQIGENLRSKRFHVAILSDQDKVNLQLNRLEQAIRQQWSEQIERILSPGYTEHNPPLSGTPTKEVLEWVFSEISSARKFPCQTNPETGWQVTSTQDFYIRKLGMRIEGDAATVECEIGLSSASRDFKGLKDSFSFVLEGGKWSLIKSENLFGLLSKASEASSQEIGTIDFSSEVLSQTKDDFTSTHLLVPVTLYTDGKTTVPRFNKTESLNLFEVNCMNSPSGIVSDIEICQDGPDFDHEFLFVSDVTSNKIIGFEQDDGVGEFGSQGTGLGQFWGPRGICTIEGYYYFVADMFNDRVICYIYYNQLDEPQFHSEFDLGAGGIFNHPRDVEAKERRPGDLQGKNYIAVADMNNHRIVLSFWWPYFQWALNYGEYGSGEGRFMWPTSVCFGREPDSAWQTNDLYVTDYGNRRLVRLHISSETVVSWGNSYDDFPIGAELTSVEVDNQGLVYVVDRHHAKVYKFAPSADPLGNFTLLGVWGQKGTEDGQLHNPNTLQVAHGRYVYDPQQSGDWFPLTGLGDAFVTESWGDQTGVRRFVIAADVLNLTAYWVPYNESSGEGNFIWWEYDLTDRGTVTEQVLRGAEVCTTYNEGTLNWGSQFGWWPVDGHPHGAYYTIKVTAASIYDPTIVVEKSVDVYVDTLTIHNPVITQGIRCNHDYPLPFFCDGCYECIQTGHYYTLDVQAYDPGGYPLTYEWSCARGWLFDGYSFYKDVITSENHVCYIPPDPEGKGDSDYEKIMVDVKNSIGGETGTSLNPGPYLYPSGTSCLGGDANGDSVVNVGDPTYIMTYLYKGGPPPPDPIERADANSDCIITVGDVVHLVDYLYRLGPPPKCCWLHEWSP